MTLLVVNPSAAIRAEPQSIPGRTRKSAKAEIYARVEQWVARWEAGVRSVHEGVWLGLLNSHELVQATASRYHSSSFCNPEYNLSGLFEWESLALNHWFGRCQTVLVGAAGAGREAIALARRGIAVTAFECHRGLAAQGRSLTSSLQLPVRYVDAEASTVPRHIGVFDGMILGWDALSYVPGQHSRISLLRQCREHVRPGGPFLLSFQTRYPSRRHVVVSRVANVIRRLRRAGERVEEGDTLAGYFRHTFTRDEIIEALQASGFDMIVYHEEPVGHAVAVRRLE